jgi:exopolysaccharide biosynthesis polyprenyl glycosylphosphotransferase
MLQAHHRTFSGTIRFADLGLFVGAAILSARWRPEASVPGLDPATIAIQIAFLVVAWLAVSSRLGVYQSRRTEDLGREIESIAEATLLALGVASLAALVVSGRVYWQPLWAGLLTFAFLAVERAIIRALLRGLRVRGYNYRYAILVGAGRSAAVLAGTLQRSRHYGLRLLGQVGLPGETSAAVPGVRDLSAIGDLRRILSEFAVDVVVLCPSQQARSGDILEVFNTCDVAGIPCHYAPSFLSLRGLYPHVVWYSSLPAFVFQSGPHAPVRLAIKRSIDLLVSVAGIVILSPVLLACALAVKLGDRGPILFRQVRVGQNGRPFHCYKFRSMVVDAEARLKELVARNEESGPVFKMKRDPRVTPVGRLLRKYSLDELPQLLNVLKGDMSLVGPRPPIPSEVQDYDWWQRRRLSVRPGITCTWQVAGRNRVPFERWMEMDLDYIDNWSLAVDMKLLAKTVGTVLKGTGV